MGKGILEKDIEILKKIEENGIKIAICSGKPTYYLCGFMRQVGLKCPILIGENGAVVQFGVDLPPKQFYILPYSEEAKQTICFLKEKIDERLPDMWYQPNLVGLTPFPKTEAEFEIISELIAENQDLVRDVVIYRHGDSFDILPKGIDKKAGLQYLGELLTIAPHEVAAIGDGINDYPMFEYAGLAIGINVKDSEKVDKNCKTLTEVLACFR